jgi:uncharacterized protein YndB with AHSA1/START domain
MSTSRKAIALWLAALFLTLSVCTSDAAAEQRPSADAVHLYVSPQGNDTADGSATHPVRSIERAQLLVRRYNTQHDVVVELADDIYPQATTLRFREVDGGQHGHVVVWQSAPGTHPVLSGGSAVTGWSLYDAAHHIYVASVPRGARTRQLWINGTLAPVATLEIQRGDYTFDRTGMHRRPGREQLPDLTHAPALELRATGFFTARIVPVRHASDDALTMAQPAWDNNLWGYDTIESPFHPELQHLYLANALALLTQPGQWYLDSAAGKLYVIPPQGTEIEDDVVILPRVAVLLSISGTPARPVHDLTLRGIRFSYTSWLGPSSAEGYASQQSGSFLVGHARSYPADPIRQCSQGCRDFESVRNAWHQMPAAVQVSAARSVHLDHDIFAHLGQYALGVGNDADATASGIGLATSDVTVTANVFTDCAGGAILAGGVQPDAHHPHLPSLINQSLIIRDNRIEDVSKEYLDNSAILSTYVAGAVIVHNEIAHVPYDAIDIGYGWGMQDAGGNANYRTRLHGYDWPQNRVYATPTTHRDVTVAANRIHDAKRLFHDGGAIYNLSASPGTLITENYIYDNHGMIALYLDEGSRYVVVRRNVVDDARGEWLNINTVHAAWPLRISTENRAEDNWHNGTRVGGLWTNYEDDMILQDHLVKDDAWPVEARTIMQNAGVEPAAGDVSYQPTLDRP